MKNELIMLVGIPGSGKSAWAKEFIKTHPHYIVHSSDELRKELYGDVNAQGKNGELFTILHKRINKDLEEGKSVIYDATNLKKRRRCAFLRGIKCWTKCVLFIEDISICKKRNNDRDRKIPDEVIDRMWKGFSPPLWNEGFDEIEIERSAEINMIELLRMTKGFEQGNSHHSLTLDKHLKKACEYFQDEDFEVKIAAGFHDVGKLFTKERYNHKGENDGNCHYYNHHCVGAYEFLLCYPLIDTDLDSALYIANLIYYHMHPYMSWKQSNKAKERDKKLLGEKMFNDIMRLHKADVAAH